MSAMPLDRSGGGSFSIAEIVNLAEEGSLRIPTFQRQFVWTAKDVRDLFDSLYRGFPVGTLLLWRRPAPAALVRLGPMEFQAPAHSNALWVVDGQQRVTSLFASLSALRRGADKRFEIYFDLAGQKFINATRGAVPSRSIPVREALETRSLLNWLRRNEEDLDPDDLDLADRLGGTMRDYRIPAYIVHGDDQALLREVFDRVNSAGRPMSRAQVFHALFAGDEQPASPESVIRALRPLRFGDLDESRIVQSVLAIRGGDVQRDIHGEFSAGEDPADWYDRVESALAATIRFLSAEGVQHLQLIPNTFPMPVLAAFFHLHPEPEPWTRRLLARWLWRGWAHGFGGEAGQTPALRRAVRAVNPRQGDPDRAPTEFEAVRALLELTPDRPTPEVELTNFSTKNAHPRLVLLAMASRGPMGSDGSRIDLSHELGVRGNSAVTQIVRGPLSNAANRSFWPPSEPESLRDIRDQAILDSHVINQRAAHALSAGDLEGFLRERAEQLKTLVFNFLDSRLEPRALVRPSIRDLALAGAAEEPE